MNTKASRKRTPLLMIVVLSFIAMPLALRTIGININFGCVIGAVIHVWGSTMKTVGRIYHPALAADFSTFSNSFSDETLQEPCTERFICQNEINIRVEPVPELESPVSVEDQSVAPKCSKHSSRLIVPEKQADMVIMPKPVAVKITPEPVQVALTPVAFRSFVLEKEIRRIRQAAQQFAHAEMVKYDSRQWAEGKKGVEEFRSNCNFAAFQMLKQSEKQKAFRVVVKVDPKAPNKKEFQFTIGPELSEF